MAVEERNFRNQYYDKMGFRVVEEKKSIEAMMGGDIIDIKRMTTFCLKFALPVIFRPLVWKVLLTVLPPHKENHDFVYGMRCQQFDQLLRCLKLLDLADESKGNKAPTFLKMFLLEEGKLGFEEATLLRQKHNRIFMHIATTMSEIYDDDKDAFFASVCFFKVVQVRYDDHHHLLPDCMIKLVRQQDLDGRLLPHLEAVQLFRHLPYARWFKGCFAGIIPSISLDKIWDKVIAGSCVILAHVGAAVLLTHRRPLLTMRSSTEMLAFLAAIPSDSADIVVSKALDSWYKTPLLLPTASKEDVPVIIDRIPS